MSVRTLPKNALQLLFLVAWSTAWISLSLVVALFAWNRDLPLVMARRIWARPLIRAAGARFAIDPLPALDFSRPHIYVMNHQSMLDIACAFAALPVNLRFVAKDILKFVPFLGWYMWTTRMIFVDRSKGVRAFRSLVKAAARIRDGASILAFPEGTRSRTGEVLPFKRGLFALALESGVPIVPVAITGSGRVLGAGGFNCTPGNVRLKVGTPILTSGRPRNGRDALMNEVRDALLDLHREIGGGSGSSGEIATAAPDTDSLLVRG